MTAELNGFDDLSTFKFVDFMPDGVNVVSTRLVYVAKPKARLVARGFSQVHTVDFLETYAPTPAASSAKPSVAIIAVENDREPRQLNVKQPFIHVDLDFNVYMKLPDSCRQDKSGRVVKLNKSVYGLQQAGHRWAMCLGNVSVSKVRMEQ